MIKKLFNVREVLSQKEQDNVKQLCACVFLKIKKKDHPIEEFNKIIQNIKVENTKMICSISYYFRMVKHAFPAYICELENEKRIIAKGSTKNSSENQIYNLYVGSITLSTKEKYKYEHSLEGIIDNVDVEMPAFGTSQEVPAAVEPEKN